MRLGAEGNGHGIKTDKLRQPVPSLQALWRMDKSLIHLIVSPFLFSSVRLVALRRLKDYEKDLETIKINLY